MGFSLQEIFSNKYFFYGVIIGIFILRSLGLAEDGHLKFFMYPIHSGEKSINLSNGEFLHETTLRFLL